MDNIAPTTLPWRSKPYSATVEKSSTRWLCFIETAILLSVVLLAPTHIIIVRIHTHTYNILYTYIFMYVWLYMYVCMYVCMHTYIHTYIYNHTSHIHKSCIPSILYNTIIYLIIYTVMHIIFYHLRFKEVTIFEIQDTRENAIVLLICAYTIICVSFVH